MIDSHCHLNFKNLKNDINKIILKSNEINIEKILSINTKIEEFETHYELIKNFSSVYISIGAHPDEIKNDNIPTVEDITKYCSKNKVIGIGETGLDFFYTSENKKFQIKSFENHIESSYKSNLPLIVHQRNSENELIDIISYYNKSKPLNIVFHCFTGSEKLRNFCLDHNFFLSFSGIITFKNAAVLRNIIKSVPLNLILIETDSPFLSPEPVRGKVNVPYNVFHIYKFLSEFFNYDFKDFEKIIDKNFYKLFPKAKTYIKSSL